MQGDITGLVITGLVCAGCHNRVGVYRAGVCRVS